MLAHHTRSEMPSATVARVVEEAYWASERFDGRTVTVADVVNNYRKDTNSLRSGYFFQKLFWQKIPYKQCPVTPEQVIKEFFRKEDSHQKCLLAVAHFHECCYLKNIPIAGQPVTADAVASSFPQSESGKLGRARFRVKCCQDNIKLNGRRITTDSVVADLKAANAPLELAYFLAHCCKNKLRIRGQTVAAEAVVNAFPDTHLGRLGRAHFIEACCLEGRRLRGQLVSTNQVLHQLQATGQKLAVACFKQSCFMRALMLNGQPVSAEEVVKGFVEARARLELARFKAHCCLKGLYLNGQRIAPKEVAESFPNSQIGFLARARFKASCCENGLLFAGQPMPPQMVINDFQTIGEQLALARFLQECCLKGLLVKGQPLPPETVAEAFRAINAALALARFKEACCLAGIKLHGKLISVDAVIDAFNAINAELELARVREYCFLNGLPIQGQLPLAEEVSESFPDTPVGKLGLNVFKANCCLKGLSLNGQPVSPQGVIDDFLALDATLEVARFRQSCCEKQIKINGRLVLPSEVIRDYRQAGSLRELAHFQHACFQQALHDSDCDINQDTVAEGFRAVGAHLDLVRFREYCCLNGIRLAGKAVTPESVVAGYRGQKEEQLNIAHFKANCCLDGVHLAGRPVSPGHVLSHFPNHHQGRMAKAHFMEDCFLRDIPVHGRPVTAESVLRGFPDTSDGRVSQARFREHCCLKGLRIDNQLVTPELVIQNFPDNPKGLLCRARFMDKCALSGMSLFGQPISTEQVLANYPPTPESKLSAGCFLEHCLFKGLTLHGEPITAEVVFNAFAAPECTLARASFQAQCCLRALPLHGQPVTTDAVVAAFADNLGGKKQLARFKKQCCLNNLLVAGKPVQPEQVIYCLEQMNQLGEKALFCAALALQARKLNGKHLCNAQVLGAFDQLPGDYATQKVNFLMQRLLALPEEEQTQESRTTFEQAWQILVNIPAKDEKFRYQRCVMLFLAMKYALPAAGQQVTPGRVWQSIAALRDSFSNTRLQFYFLADCYCTGTKLDGQPVCKQQVLDCLEKFLPSRLRQALSCWFERLCCQSHEPDTLSHVLPNLPPNTVPPPQRPTGIEAYVRDLHVSSPSSAEVVDRRLHPELINSQTRQVLEIARGIEGLCLTGSFSRLLQGVGSSFNDIDMIASEPAINTLIARLTSQLGNQESEAEIPCKVLARMAPGCPELRLNAVFTITLSEGDLGQKVSVLQASVSPPQSVLALSTIKAEIPGQQGTISCLTFAAEIALLIDTLKHLAEQLDPLTARLLDGPGFNIPRTILFNWPQDRQECVFGLLMRCLLTLNKARQFLALLADQESTLQQTLQACTAQLQERVQRHSHREPLVTRVTRWLAGTGNQAKRSAFLHTLLDILTTPLATT